MKDAVERVLVTRVESLIPAFQPKWTVTEGVRELQETLSRDGLSAASFTRYRRFHLVEEGRRNEGLK